MLICEPSKVKIIDFDYVTLQIIFQIAYNFFKNSSFWVD